MADKAKSIQSSELTVEQLRQISRGGDPKILDNTVKAFNQYADKFDINTALRKAHFIAQIAHESDYFATTREYGGSKTRYAPWYGRGLIQTTWETNYILFYQWAVEQDLNPPEFFTSKGREAVAEFPWAFISAIWYWDAHRLNRFADKDDVRAVTKTINGGYNGLAKRIELLNRAKKVFAATRNPVDVAEGSITQKTFKVIDVQNALIAAGFSIVNDGKMGPKTVAAVKMFQKVNELVPDGVIGPKTIEKLFA